MEVNKSQRVKPKITGCKLLRGIKAKRRKTRLLCILVFCFKTGHQEMKDFDLNCEAAASSSAKCQVPSVKFATSVILVAVLLKCVPE